MSGLLIPVGLKSTPGGENRRPETVIFAAALLVERLARSKNADAAAYRRLTRLADSLKSVAASMVGA